MKISFFILLFIFTICKSNECSVGVSQTETFQEKNVFIHGTGASLPSLLYTDWIYGFSLLKTNVEIDYIATGSGRGIEAVKNGEVDWAGSDIMLTDEELEENPHVRMYSFLKSVVIPFYNIPEIGQNNLALSLDTVAKIFSLQITRWRDPEILASNPDYASIIPDEEIILVLRGDKSGTTLAFQTGLNRSDNWIGEASSVWDSDIYNNTLKAQGNIYGFATVLTVPYSISYTGPHFIAGSLPYAYIDSNGNQLTYAADDWPFYVVTNILVNTNGLNNNCSNLPDFYKFLVWCTTEQEPANKANQAGFFIVGDINDLLDQFFKATCDDKPLIKYNITNRSGVLFWIILVVLIVAVILNTGLAIGYILQATSVSYQIYTVTLLLGTTCSYAACFFWLLTPNDQWICTCRIVFTFMGLTTFLLAIGVRVLQIYRVYLMKKGSSLKKTSDSSQAMFLASMTIPIFLAQAIYLVFWMIFNPIGTCSSTPNILNIDLEVMYNCNVSESVVYWLLFEGIFMVLLLILGIAMLVMMWTFQKEIYEYKFLMLTMYNFFLILVVAGPLAVQQYDNESIVSVVSILSIFILIAGSGGYIYVMKVLGLEEIIKQKTGKSTYTRNSGVRKIHTTKTNTQN